MPADSVLGTVLATRDPGEQTLELMILVEKMNNKVSKRWVRKVVQRKTEKRRRHIDKSF